LCIWRDVELNDGALKLYVQKVRNKNVGSVGEVDLQWTRANGIITQGVAVDISAVMDKIPPAPKTWSCSKCKAINALKEKNCHGCSEAKVIK
jgi:hypothetical protein